MMPKVTRFRLKSPRYRCCLRRIIGLYLTVNSRTDIGSQIVTISLGEGSVNNNYTIIATDTAKLTINPTLLLPSTGGIGLLPFVFLGLIFIFLASFILSIVRKSR